MAVAGVQRDGRERAVYESKGFLTDIAEVALEPGNEHGAR
jgi:hypothetical protein